MADGQPVSAKTIDQVASDVGRGRGERRDACRKCGNTLPKTRAQPADLALVECSGGWREPSVQ